MSKSKECRAALQHATVMDITVCSICRELYVDPKVLPCLHTFCAKCLNTSVNNKDPVATLECSLCKHSCSITPGGIKELTNNFFIKRLVETRNVSSTLELVPCVRFVSLQTMTRHKKQKMTVESPPGIASIVQYIFARNASTFTGNFELRCNTKSLR